jgi:hypothetical protein
MINFFPVSTAPSEECDGMTCVVTSSRRVIAKTYSKHFAKTVAKALNALHTLPDFQVVSDSADEGGKNEAIVDALNKWLEENKL